MAEDTSTAAADADVFSSILDLEEQYYAEGHALGTADGAQSGRIEGRVFGLEKGFEKFFDIGRLHGRASVWREECKSAGLERTQRHVERLLALTDPSEFVTLNTEEAVDDVDERARDAKGKERIIMRALGEREGDSNLRADDSGASSKEKSMQDATLRVKRTNGATSGAGSINKRAPTGEMEDFMGLPGGQRTI